MRLALLILIICIHQEYNAQWTLTPVPTTNNLKSMHFGNQNIGYAVGSNGVALKTTDQGNTWQILNLGTTADFSSVHCSNSDTLFISKKYPLPNYECEILRSFNAGVTWSVSKVLVSGYTTCIYSKSPNLVCVVGASWAMNYTTHQYEYRALGYVSKNNGLSWDWGHSLGDWKTVAKSVFFIDSLTGFACGNSYKLYKTINGGNDWTSIVPTPFSSPIELGNSVHFINNNVGFIVGDNGLIRKTTDGGITWNKQIGVGGTNHLRSIYFTGLDTGCAVGDNGIIVGTIDGGVNWQTQASGTTKNLMSVHFTNSSTGYIVGDNGTVLKTTHSPVGLKELDKKQDGINIYPVNVKDNLTVDHKKVEGSIVISNMVGKELVHENFEGTSNIIDMKNLSNGIYLITVKSGLTIYSKKIIKE